MTPFVATLKFGVCILPLAFNVVVPPLSLVELIVHPPIRPAVFAVNVEQVIAPLTVAYFNTAEVALITPLVATLKLGV